MFNYRTPLRFEMLTVLGYDSSRKDFFGPHRDNLRAEQRRRFALSLNLNDGYEGGELVFPEYGPHKFAPPKGAGAIFSCEVLHEACTPERPPPRHDIPDRAEQFRRPGRSSDRRLAVHDHDLVSAHLIG